MQIYLDNIIFSLQRAGGISVYWYELLRRMLRDGLPMRAIEDGSVHHNIFREKLNIPKEQIIHCNALSKKFARYFPPRVTLPEGCVFHSSYYRAASGSRCHAIETAYDFTYERFRRGLPRLVHSLQKRFALQSAHGVICISESTKSDLLRFIPELSADKVRVIHLGYSDEFHPVPASHWNGNSCEGLHSSPYLVYVGDRSFYKNFHLAVQAVGQLPGYALVVVGGGALSQADQSMLEELLPGRYLHLDRLPNVELNMLYNNAHALIYPSSYEGFGIPVIEAMAAGCPVIATNTSSIPEAAGRAALLVDEASAEEFAERIRALENSSFRESVIQLGFENIRRFSWERCYQETIAFYQEIQSGAQTK